MAVGLKYRSLANIRPVGAEVIAYDYYTIPGVPASGSVLFRLTELALNVPLPNPDNSSVECREVDAFDVELPGPVRLTPIDQYGVLTAGKFVIKAGTQDADDTFRFGQIRFSQWDAGRRFKIIYTGRGSLVYADDVLNLNSGESLLPNVIKPDHISNSIGDVFTFPDNTVVEGSLSVLGNFNIQGEINKSVSEVLTTSDTYLRLNDDFTTGTPTADGGIQIRRGSSPDAELKWNEALVQWEVIGGPLSIPLGISINRHDAVATAGQTIFTLPFSYNAGTKQLFVYLNGMLQTQGAIMDYQETSISLGLSSEVTFTQGVELDSRLSFVVIGV